MACPQRLAALPDLTCRVPRALTSGCSYSVPVLRCGLTHVARADQVGDRRDEASGDHNAAATMQQVEGVEVNRIQSTDVLCTSLATRAFVASSGHDELNRLS